MLIQIRELRPVKRFDILGKYGWFDHGQPLQVANRQAAIDEVNRIQESLPGRSFNFKVLEGQAISNNDAIQGMSQDMGKSSTVGSCYSS